MEVIARDLGAAAVEVDADLGAGAAPRAGSVLVREERKRRGFDGLHGVAWYRGQPVARNVD